MRILSTLCYVIFLEFLAVTVSAWPADKTCPPGYAGHRCLDDIDECAIWEMVAGLRVYPYREKCQALNLHCLNTGGGFSCVAKDEWTGMLKEGKPRMFTPTFVTEEDFDYYKYYGY